MFALILIRLLPLFVGLCFATLFVTAPLQAWSKSLDTLLPPHTPSGATATYFPSPDRLYEARLTGGDGVPRFLSLYQIAGKYQLAGKHQHLMRLRIAGAQSFVWVPHHPHTLAVAADGSVDDDSLAQLSLWSGGQRLRELVPVKDKESEGFEIDGVTPDGKVLVYDHFVNGTFLINLRLKLLSP